MKSKLISLSAISAGFVAICLLVGSIFEVADLSAIFLSSLFVTMPLYFKSYKFCFLTYLVGGIIAFACSGFNLLSLVFPAYFAFFGIYPIIKFLFLDKKTNKILSIIIGLIWMVAIVIGLYFYYTLFMGISLNGLPQWVIDYILIFIVVLSIVFFFVYDKFLSIAQKVVCFYLNKIIK